MGIFKDMFTEARSPTVTPPEMHDVARIGYETGIPIGGSTPTNQGMSAGTGSVDRQTACQEFLEAYLACYIVSVCVDTIARTITAGGLQIIPNAMSLEDNTIPDPPWEVQQVQQLFAYVNPNEDIRQLMRGVITDLLIFGDSFTEVTWITIGGKNLPVGLYPLDPTTMSIIADEHGTLRGYHQTTVTGHDVDFAPHEVVHVKMDAPGNPLYGVGWIQKNLLPIQTWLYTEGLIKESMKAGDPLRIWIDWPAGLPPTEMERFQQQYQIRNRGIKNLGNPFETKGGAEVKELATNAVDKWMEISNQARDQIISGFGIYPAKAGVIESGNIGGGTASGQDRNFKVNTCGPLEEIVLEKFSFALLYQAYGVKDWHMKFGEVDWRDDIVIEQIRDLRLRNGSWSLNRLKTDIGEPPIEGGDDCVLVDRQNMVLWSDMNPLSKANVAAVEAKSMVVPPPSQQTQGKPGTAPGSPKTPGGTEAFPIDLIADEENDPRYAYRYSHLAHQNLSTPESLWEEISKLYGPNAG